MARHAAANHAANSGLARVHAAPLLDLGSLAAIKAWAATSMPQAVRQVDFLFNNAGFVPVGNATTTDGLEQGFGISHVGHFALTRELRKSGVLGPAATVVQVSSGMRILCIYMQARALLLLLLLTNTHTHPQTHSHLRDIIRASRPYPYPCVVGRRSSPRCLPLVHPPRRRGWRRRRLEGRAHHRMHLAFSILRAAGAECRLAQGRRVVQFRRLPARQALKRALRAAAALVACSAITCRQCGRPPLYQQCTSGYAGAARGNAHPACQLCCSRLVFMPPTLTLPPPLTPPLRTPPLRTSVSGTVYTRLAEQVARPFAKIGGWRIQTDEMQAATMRFFLRPPLAAAAVVLRAAAAARHSPGAFCNGMGEPVPDELLPPSMRDDELAARLWKVTERLVQQYEEHAKAAA